MNILDVLRGIVLNPVLTAFARGVLEAVAFVVLYAVADFAVAYIGANMPEYSMLIPLLWTMVRTGEGVVDKIDTAKQRQREAIRDSTAPGYDFPKPANT